MTNSLSIEEAALLLGAPSRVRMSHPRHRWLPVAALLAPSLVFLVLFTYGPVLRVFVESLMVGRFAGQNAIGIGNYQRLFADPHFTRAALNNLLYAVGTISPSLILALGLALALRETTRLSSILRTTIVMPLLIPLVAAAALFTGEGLLDFYLRKLGVGMVNWLGNPDLALGAVIAITVWKNTGYYMLFFLAGLAGVPAGPRRRGKDRRRRRVAATAQHRPADAGADIRICCADRLVEFTDPGRSRSHDDAGRPVRCDQSAALLHLPAGGAELRYGPRVGGYGAALAAFRAVETASPEWPVAIAARGFVEGAAGQTAAAAATLQQLQMLSRRRFVTPYGIALVEAGLGRWDEALATLETALVERSHWLVWLRLDPRWGNLRSAPRFAHLVDYLNFPD